MELGEEYQDALVDFAKAHVDIYRITNITKYRSFQYRLLQRGLVTNIQLQKWGIKDSKLCSFCKQDTETILHLLYYCPIVKELWDDLVQMIYLEYQVKEVRLAPTNVIFNTIIPQGKHVGNFLCLVLKQYIYAQKCLSVMPSKYQFRLLVKRIECIEKYIAVKNDKINIHMMKWQAAATAAVTSNDALNQYIDAYIENM